MTDALRDAVLAQKVSRHVAEHKQTDCQVCTVTCCHSDTCRAFNWVIDQGWAFYWGTSEWSTEQLQEVSTLL